MEHIKRIRASDFVTPSRYPGIVLECDPDQSGVLSGLGSEYKFNRDSIPNQIYLSANKQVEFQPCRRDGVLIALSITPTDRPKPVKQLRKFKSKADLDDYLENQWIF